VTAGEQLIEQGRQQGIEQGLQQGIEQSIEQGLQQGIEEGRQQGKRELLLRVLRRRFGNAMNHEAERRFASAPITQIDAWVERVFSAATVTEFLAD
jgi:flagellar biosynthesis/type III secretory pathway protein FliH